MDRPGADATAPPILVTGTHRSGSTWVGEMLALSPTVHYVHEPFAPMYERSWLRHPPDHRFYHERPDAEGRFAEDLDRIVALRPPWSAIANRRPSLKNLARIAQEVSATAVARRRGARALLKDPFALLSAEWIASRTQAEIVVLVRHPAAFASSVKRLGWRLDVTWLLDQSELMSSDLAPFRDALERERDGDTDLIDHAGLVWSVLNAVVARYASEHPEWSVLRYEDLAAEPVTAFQRLYGRLGVPWNDDVARAIEDTNSSRHGGEVTDGRRGGTRRDSRAAMWTWTDRLTRAEIDRIRSATQNVAPRWYAADDWEPTTS